jgi:hypothetical protein
MKTPAPTKQRDTRSLEQLILEAKQTDEKKERRESLSAEEKANIEYQ